MSSSSFVHCHWITVPLRTHSPCVAPLMHSHARAHAHIHAQSRSSTTLSKTSSATSASDLDDSVRLVLVSSDVKSCECCPSLDTWRCRPPATLTSITHERSFFSHASLRFVRLLHYSAILHSVTRFQFASLAYAVYSLARTLDFLLPPTRACTRRHH